MNFTPNEFLSFEQKLTYLASTPTDDTLKGIVGYQAKMVISQLVQLLIMDLVVSGQLSKLNDGGFRISEQVKPGASIRVEIPTATHVQMDDATLEQIVRSILESGKVECAMSVKDAVIVLKRPATVREIHRIAS